MGLETKTTKRLCLKGLKTFSAQSHLPTALKLLIATEDDWVEAEDFVVKAGLWLRLLEIEEGSRDASR
jgi:hypothetical protein